MSQLRRILWVLLPFCPTLAGMAYYNFWWLSHEGVPVRLDVSTTVVNIRTDANRSLPINRDLTVKSIEVIGPFEFVRISRARPGQAMCEEYSGTKRAGFQLSGGLRLEWDQSQSGGRAARNSFSNLNDRRRLLTVRWAERFPRRCARTRAAKPAVQWQVCGH